MKRIINSIFALCCTLPALSFATPVTLTTLNWPPFYAEELENGGFISVIVEEAFKASGYESNIEFTTWQNALDTVKTGEKDAIVGGYFSEERAKTYHYSSPIYTVLTGIIKKDTFPLNLYTSFEMLDEYKIGKLDQGLIGENFDAFPFSKLTGYTEISDGLKALNSGEIDLYADSLAVAKHAAAKAGMDPASLQLVQPPVDQNDLYLLISKAIPNGEVLRDAFNSGLIQIQSNGTYDQILADYKQN